MRTGTIHTATMFDLSYVQETRHNMRWKIMKICGGRKKDNILAFTAMYDAPARTQQTQMSYAPRFVMENDVKMSSIFRLRRGLLTSRWEGD